MTYLVEVLQREGIRVGRDRDFRLVLSPHVDLELEPEQEALLVAATYSPGHRLAVCDVCCKERLRPKGGASRKCDLTPRCPGMLTRAGPETTDLYHRLLRAVYGPLIPLDRQRPSH